MEIAEHPPAFKVNVNRKARKKGQVSAREAEFARLVVAGMTKSEAYKTAIGKKANQKTCWAEGARTAGKPEVKAYIESLQQASWTAEAMSLAEKRAYLARAVRTPINEITGESDLAQEIIKTTRTDKAGTVYEEERIKTVNKLQALELDSKIAGDFYSDREGNGGNPFGWLVVMHKGNREEKPVLEMQPIPAIAV